MAKSSRALPLLATVLCFLSLLGFARCHDKLYVQGKVYCDTCRVAFVTPVSEYLSGAKVRLECKNREAGHVTYSVEGKCDATGTYLLPVDGNHEEEICEVVLVESSRPDCNEHLPTLDRARVLLTTNNGIADAIRIANSLGFLKTKSLTCCPDMLRSMGLGLDSMLPPMLFPYQLGFEPGSLN